MDVFEVTGDKNPNLRKLHEALKQIPPTTVTCENDLSFIGDKR